MSNNRFEATYIYIRIYYIRQVPCGVVVYIAYTLSSYTHSVKCVINSSGLVNKLHGTYLPIRPRKNDRTVVQSYFIPKNGSLCV